MGEADNRQKVIRAKLLDVERIIVTGGKIQMEGGGVIEATQGGNIAIETEGAGAIELPPIEGPIVPAGSSVSLAEALCNTQGSPGTGFFDITGNCSDGELVTIGARVYEFDTGGAVGPGHVLVDIAADQSALPSAAALAAAINADVQRPASAYDVGDGTVLIVGPYSAIATLSLSTTGINIDRSAPSIQGDDAPRPFNVFMLKHTFNAADVAVLTDTDGEVPIAALPVAYIGTNFVFSILTADGHLQLSDKLKVTNHAAGADYIVISIIDENIASTDIGNGDTITMIGLCS
jgi:hypothetical protein